MDEKIDTRNLPRVLIEEKRRQTRKLQQLGMTRAETGAQVGVLDTAGRWLKPDKKNLKVNCDGRHIGDGRHLSPDQEKLTQMLIIDKAPDLLGW